MGTALVNFTGSSRIMGALKREELTDGHATNEGGQVRDRPSNT